MTNIEGSATELKARANPNTHTHTRSAGMHAHVPVSCPAVLIIFFSFLRTYVPLVPNLEEV